MKKIYTNLVTNKKELPENAINKWRRDLHKDIDTREILSAHTENHWCVNNHKLKSFNCNFLNRNLPTNKKLKDMKKREDDKCSFCGEKEDIIHQYWECKTRKNLWHHLGRIHQQITNKILVLRKEKCLLGIDKNYSKREQKTHRSLCLLVKHYIHLCKCREDEEPSPRGLENYLKQYIRIEKICAEKNNTLYKFDESWRGWGDWSAN
jgi:hypothetical protein